MYDDFKLANYSRALVSPELYARHLSRLLGGDVLDGLTVTPGTGLQVILQPGNALVRYGSANVASARLVSLVNTFNLAIGTADASNPRIDLVVLYIDNAVTLPSGTPTSANLDGKGVAKAKVVPGTPASSPSAPNATAIQASVGSGNPYTILQAVRVDAGVAVIAANKITDVRSLANPTAANEQPWQTPTLQNGWVKYGDVFTDPAYMKDSRGFVHVRGLVKSGTVGATIFTLPAGYRPAGSVRFATDSNGAYAAVTVTAAGLITSTGSNTWVFLDAILFRAEN